jgi:hypothetical protein
LKIIETEIYSTVLKPNQQRCSNFDRHTVTPIERSSGMTQLPKHASLKLTKVTKHQNLLQAKLNQAAAAAIIWDTSWQAEDICTKRAQTSFAINQTPFSGRVGKLVLAPLKKNN